MINVRLESGGPGGGYWYASWTTATGSQQRKSLGSKKKVGKREASRLCREMGAKIDQGWRPGSKPPPLTKWLRVFLTQRDIKRSSRVEYECTVRILVAHAGDMPIHTFTRQHAADFRAALMEGDRAESTIRKHIRNCKALFGEAVKQDILSLNPFDREVGGVLKMDHEWDYVNVETIERVLDAAPDLHWKALIALARYAGLRRAEALRLTWSDIDFDAHMLVVRNHHHKRTTKDRRREVPVCPRLHRLLLDRFADAAEGDPLVVGLSKGYMTGSNPRGGRAVFKSILRRAGVEGWGKPLHTLRKSCETDWLGKYPISDVVKIMGHDPKVALEHYHQTSAATYDKITGKSMSSDARRIAELEAELLHLKSKGISP